MRYTTFGNDVVENETVATIEKETGPDNFLRVMSLRPETMEAWLRFYDSLMGPGSVDRRIKEMVYLAVSHINECSYCTSHHEKAAREAGLSEDVLRDIQFEINRDFSQKEQAALQYARELTRTASVDDSLRFNVAEHFSPAQMVELTMVVALANLTNRFNNGLAVPLEH